MTIALVAAMDRNRLIGAGNQLPWRLPADMQHFRRITLGQTVLMGRLTWESLGKPLPDRPNLVLSRGDLHLQGAQQVRSIDQALALTGDQPLMVIGGARLYAAALPRAERLYLTFVDGEFEGDTWFPQWDENEWAAVEETHHPADDKNGWDMRFVTYERSQ